MQHRTGRRAWKTILEDLQTASVRCDGWQGSGDHPDSGMDPRRGGGQAESLPTETLTAETSFLEDKERKHHVIPVWGRTRFYPEERAMAPHSRTLAWKIPWTEEPGGLQSMGSLQVRYDWATSLSLSCIGGGNGNPLQCSCLENLRDQGAWKLPFMGSHRVGQDWSDLAAAAAGFTQSGKMKGDKK